MTHFPNYPPRQSIAFWLGYRQTIFNSCAWPPNLLCPELTQAHYRKISGAIGSFTPDFEMGFALPKRTDE